VIGESAIDCILGIKLRNYLEIPSLTDVLLVEQDYVWIEYWFREPGGEWGRKVWSDLRDILKIESLGCEIPVAEIYSKVEFEAQESL
jgi:hypothetical protein